MRTNSPQRSFELQPESIRWLAGQY